jgi:hypothetical protein
VFPFSIYKYFEANRLEVFLLGLVFSNQIHSFQLQADLDNAIQQNKTDSINAARADLDKLAMNLDDVKSFQVILKDSRL